MSRKEVMKSRIFSAINMLKTGKYEFVSPSLLQRRLMLSYYQAVRLMRKLEELDIVGPSRGKNPRILKKAP